MAAHSPDPTPAELLAQIARALVAARDELLQISELLRVHLYSVDREGRAQAAALAQAAIEQARTTSRTTSHPPPP